MKLTKIAAALTLILAVSSFAHAGDFAGVPELDPSVIGSVCLLIGGATLIIRAQRAKS